MTTNVDENAAEKNDKVLLKLFLELFLSMDPGRAEPGWANKLKHLNNDKNYDDK